MIPIKFFKMIGLIKNQPRIEMNAEITVTSDSHEMLETELQSGLEELAVEHVDTDKYKNGVNNIKTLCEAIEKHDKVRLEQQKVLLQIAEAEQRRAVNWDVVLPKVGGCVAAVVITCFWLALEQGTPLSMRLVSTVTALTMPKL